MSPEAVVHDRDCALNDEPWYMFNTACTCKRVAAPNVLTERNL